MSKFVIGEVAIVTRSHIPEFPVGCEVTVLAVNDHPLFQYMIFQHGYDSIWANDASLRKRRPFERTDAELVADLVKKITTVQILEDA